MFLIFGLVHLIVIPFLKCELPPTIDDNDEETASLIENQDKESHVPPESSSAQQTNMVFDSSRSQEARNEPEVSYYELYKDPLITL